MGDDQRYSFRGHGIRSLCCNEKLHKGDWVIGALVQRYADTNFGGEVITAIYYQNDHTGYFVKVDPATVGQCTGFIDKNGALIFEGDVLDNGYDSTGVVEWCDCRYIIGYSKDEDGDWDNYDDLLSAGSAEKPKGGTWRFEDMEVIGNIYDNPELLEAEG